MRIGIEGGTRSVRGNYDDDDDDDNCYDEWVFGVVVVAVVQSGCMHFCNGGTCPLDYSCALHLTS